MAIQCPGCSRQFKSYNALSTHTNHCQQMPRVMAAAARHYAEPDTSEGPRKRCRISFSAVPGDEEEQGSIEADDFKVSHDVPVYCQFLRVYEQSQIEEPCQGITPSNSKGGLPAPEAGACAQEGGVGAKIDLAPSQSGDSQDKAEPQTAELTQLPEVVEGRVRPGGPT